MKGVIPKRINIAFYAGLLLLLIAAGMFIYERQLTLQSVRLNVESHLKADFAEKVSAAEKSAAVFAAAPAAYSSHSLHPEVHLLFHKQALVAWSNNEFMPDLNAVRQIPARASVTFKDQNKLFYIRKTTLKHDTAVYSLIPLSIDYPVNNQVLQDYIFLGRYNDSKIIRQHLTDFVISTHELPDAVQLKSPEGSFLASILLPGKSLFTRTIKKGILLLFLLGFFLVCLSLFRKLKPVRGYRLPAVIFLVLIFLIRILLLIIDFPAQYLETELFSPTILAVSTWNPSLGDLSLNMALIFIAAFIITRIFYRDIGLFFKRLLKNSIRAWITAIMLILLNVGLVSLFLFFSNSIIRNSNIYFQFLNIFDLNLHSVILFLVFGCMLGTLLIIQLQAFRFFFHFLEAKARLNYRKLAMLTLLLLAMVSIIYPAPAMFTGTILAFFMPLGVVLRSRDSLSWNFDFLNFLLILILFSGLTTSVVIKGIGEQERVQKEQFAKKIARERDVALEYLITRTTDRLRKDPFLSQLHQATDSIPGLAELIRDRYFNANFQGYQANVYLFDDSLKRIDTQGELKPQFPPDPLIPMDELATERLDEGVFMLNMPKGYNANVYVSQVPVRIRRKDFLIHVEFLPGKFAGNRLFPGLLLDEKTLSKMAGTGAYDYAVFENGFLVRQQGESPFPLFMETPNPMEAGEFSVHRTESSNLLFHSIREGKFVLVRSDRLSLFERITIFSFIFYFFVVAFILVLGPYRLSRWMQQNRQGIHFNLRSRLQIFLLSVSVLPLLIVIFLLSPYVKARFYEDVRTNLREETSRIATQLTDEFRAYRRAWNHDPAFERGFRETLRQVSTMVDEDINIFDAGGQLWLSTQPDIYSSGVLSGFMNYEALRSIRTGALSSIVINESVGNLSYISSYHPIFSENMEIIGFVNIPYLSQQDDLNRQLVSLLAFLADIYVLVFLAIGIVAVFVSNSVTRPLTLLSKKLEETRLGDKNEPIVWKSQDEIGEMIRSYNHMLEKLEESQKKLSATERELAWKEMARQVAHEIKNPLTPMRLSVQHLSRAWNDKSDKLPALFEKVTNTILLQISQLVNIADSFSEFAKMPEPKKEHFDLFEVIRGVAALYESHETLEITAELPEQAFMVIADQDQMSRVFNNLIKNAIQATEGIEGGKVTVRARLEDGHAYVEVEDTGKGIEPEIQKKIFQPNFSTKSSGMGLGLAIVKKIIEQAGGLISFQSTPGEGTTFYIKMPAADAE